MEEGQVLKRWPKYASPKLDGIRGSTQDGAVLSNSLKHIPNVHIQNAYAPYQGLDGEFLTGDPTDALACNTTFSVVMSQDKPITDTKFYVFDQINLQDPFWLRLQNYRGVQLPESLFVVIPQIEVHNMEQAMECYRRFIAMGYEGMMLRAADSIYKAGRSTAKSEELLKFKEQDDAEFTVEGFYEAMHNMNEAYTNELGRTARSSHQENKVGKGMIGGFLTSYNGQPMRVSAGKLTHKERQHIWENQAEYMGRLGVYTYMVHGQVDLPRQGRFKTWRSPDDL